MIRDKNNELIEKSITELHSRLESQALNRMREIDAFDVDDLARDLEQTRDMAIDEYKNTMKDFSATNSYKLHLYELNVRSDLEFFSIFVDYLKDNLALYRTY